MHLEDVPMPHVNDIPNGKRVLVKVLRVGVDGTTLYPGQAKKLLTTPIQGLENFEQMLHELTQNREAIKVYVEVASSQ